MKIGDLAQRTGVSIRMLRYYEERGMIAPARTAGGYRDYGPVEEAVVNRIQLLGQAGLTLDAIAAIMPCMRTAEIEFEPCEDLRRLLKLYLDRLDGRLDTLNRSRSLLAGYLDGIAK